jgi:hypothetical protein
MARAGETVTLFDGTSETCRHVCGFFASREEEYQVLLPFIREGFERGDKAFHVVDPKLQADHLRRLEASGIDAQGAAQSGQLEFCDWNAAYLPDGRFNQDRMLAKWQAIFETAGQAGYKRTRLLAHMEWSLEDRPGVDQLLEYEARFNQLPPHPNPVVCAYDLTRFPADLIIDVMRTHPLVLVRGIVHENPFFVPPDQFVEELRAARR